MSSSYRFWTVFATGSLLGLIGVVADSVWTDFWFGSGHPAVLVVGYVLLAVMENAPGFWL